MERDEISHYWILHHPLADNAAAFPQAFSTSQGIKISAIGKALVIFQKRFDGIWQPCAHFIGKASQRLAVQTGVDGVGRCN